MAQELGAFVGEELAAIVVQGVWRAGAAWSGEGAVSRGIERRAGLRPPQPGRVGAAGAWRGLGRCAEEDGAAGPHGLALRPSWPNNRLQQAAANRGVQVSVGAGRSSA